MLLHAYQIPGWGCLQKLQHILLIVLALVAGQLGNGEGAMRDVPIKGPGCYSAARLQDAAMKEALRLLGEHHVVRGGSPGAFAEDRYAIRIAAKADTVVLNPFKCQHLILKTRITGHIQVGCLQAEKTYGQRI